MSEGIEAGKKHHNAPKSDSSRYYATTEPYKDYLMSLREQQEPGYLLRQRKAEAAARVAARKQEAADARAAEQGAQQLRELGLTF